MVELFTKMATLKSSRMVKLSESTATKLEILEMLPGPTRTCLKKSRKNATRKSRRQMLALAGTAYCER
jgi:hypothetical protein